MPTRGKELGCELGGTNSVFQVSSGVKVSDVRRI